MEYKYHALSKFSTSINILPYLCDYHVAQILMNSLSKSTKELWNDNYKAFHKAFIPKYIKVDNIKINKGKTMLGMHTEKILTDVLDYLLNEDRYASYDIIFTLKSIEDATVIIQFLNSVDKDLLILQKVIHYYSPD